MINKSKYIAILALGAASFALPGLAFAGTCIAKDGKSTSSSSGDTCSVSYSSSSSVNGVSHSLKITTSLSKNKVASCSVITDGVFIGKNTGTNGTCATSTTAGAMSQVK